MRRRLDRIELMKIRLNINGEKRTFEAPARTRLIDLLRQAMYYSVKHGCETGDCGSCAVIIDGKALNTCIMLAAQAQGKKITTLESLGTPDQLHPIQAAFVDHGAIQCGYCTPAMILAAKALLDREPNPTPALVMDALAGALCRCTGYVKPVEAVMAAAKTLAGAKAKRRKARDAS